MSAIHYIAIVMIRPPLSQKGAPMSAVQKYAWFNLLVIAATLAAVAVLYPWLGTRALGALGLLGFLGCTPLFFRRRPGQVIADERDALIWHSSSLVAFALYWVAFSSVALIAPAVYGDNGAVPVSVIQLGVAAALMLLLSIQSVVMLFQYARGQ
jgi:hypothetical protein